MLYDKSKRRFIKKSSLACLSCNPIFSSGSLIAQSLPDFKLTPALPEDFDQPAMFYINTPKGIRCQLCPSSCTLKNNEVGDCRTRINKNGQLVTIAYGNPCAVHIDPIEKKPLFHFLPGSRTYSIATAGCNLACLNCQNWQISQKSPKETRNYQLMPDQVVEESVKANCKSIAYTYSDPVAFYEYTLDTAAMAQEQGIKNILISAGYINQKPLENWCNKIDAANIDLKSFSEDIYAMLNAGKLEPVLTTLKTLKENGIWLEISNLVVPNWTDDFDMIKEMCNWLASNGFEHTPLHFSRFHPQYKLMDLIPTPKNKLIRATQIAHNEGLKHVYIGNIANNPSENTICPNCKTIVVERKGYKVVKNNMDAEDCKNCHEKIYGIWS